MVKRSAQGFHLFVFKLQYRSHSAVHLFGCRLHELCPLTDQGKTRLVVQGSGKGQRRDFAQRKSRRRRRVHPVLFQRPAAARSTQ